MFALETAYTITARLILAKTLEDKTPAAAPQGIVGVPYSRFIQAFFPTRAGISRSGRLPQNLWTTCVLGLFDQYENQAFASVYAQDIFDWWRAAALASNASAAEVGSALARLVLALASFNFARLEGDLLGELYQRYFDAETRKALGEFYTPPEVVEFILDQIDYQGDGKLLDPATGSGTFLVAALRRFLRANANRDAEETLRRLGEAYEIVGFDINPFAVLMAQLNVAALLVPLFVKAATKNPEFRLRRLPVIRTDSLRMETQEEVHERGVQAGFVFGDRTVTAHVELPIRAKGKEGFHKVKVEFLRFENAKRDALIKNEREWLVALQATFEAVRTVWHQMHPPRAHEREATFEAVRTVSTDLPEHPDEALRTVLDKELGANRTKLRDALLPYALKLVAQLEELWSVYDDGRFLKSLEDLMLGLVVKHYLEYDAVVGNPPYVRIQNLPETQRGYWGSMYTWAQGNFDIYIPFFERALGTGLASKAGTHAWLREGGRLGFIVPNRVRIADYATELRKRLVERNTLRTILDIGACEFRPDEEAPGAKLFREAMVYPAIVIAERQEAASDSRCKVMRFRPVEVDLSPREALVAARSSLSRATEEARPVRGGKNGLDYAEVFTVPQGELGARGWFLMPRDERAIFKKVIELGVKPDPEIDGKTRILQHFTATGSGGFQGIVTGSDEVMVLRELSRDGNTLVVTSAAATKPFEMGAAS